jgi:chaperonin GroES
MTTPIPILRPIQDRIFCEKLSGDIARASGLIIPQSTEKQDQWRVAAVGPGRRLGDGSVRPMSVAVGDIVVFPETRGQMFVFAERELSVVNEEHLVAKVIDDVRLVPLNDVIIAEECAPQGLVATLVPSHLQDRDEARALAVGPGGIMPDGAVKAMELRAGDRFLYNKRMCDDFRFRDQKLIAVREAFVVCISERDDEAA